MVVSRYILLQNCSIKLLHITSYALLQRMHPKALKFNFETRKLRRKANGICICFLGGKNENEVISGFLAINDVFLLVQ